MLNILLLHLLICILRISYLQVGGPSWTVKLGRRDSTTASKTLANTDLPLFTDDLQTLISKFKIKDLTAKDMVALSGKFHFLYISCQYDQTYTYMKN